MVVGETVAGMSEGPEKDVGRYLRWLGRTSGPLGFCYHILYGEHSTLNHPPGLCDAVASEEKLNQYLVFSEKGLPL